MMALPIRFTLGSKGLLLRSSDIGVMRSWILYILDRGILPRFHIAFGMCVFRGEPLYKPYTILTYFPSSLPQTRGEGFGLHLDITRE